MVRGNETSFVRYCSLLSIDKFLFSSHLAHDVRVHNIILPHFDLIVTSFKVPIAFVEKKPFNVIEFRELLC